MRGIRTVEKKEVDWASLSQETRDAIEVFRSMVRAERKFRKLETQLNECVTRVPKDEMDAYVLETQRIEEHSAGQAE